MIWEYPHFRKLPNVVNVPGGSPFATVHDYGGSEEPDLQHDVHEQRI